LDLPILFLAISHHAILRWDFNCLLHPIDTTGPFQIIWAPSDIVQGLALIDTWCQAPNDRHIHHSPTGANILDRIYMTRDLITRKSGIELLPAALTENHAVLLRLTIQDQLMRRRRGTCTIDPNMTYDDHKRAV
jgi:hypothetical protein